MNIGPIVRGLLGESRAGQPKELELKMGQVIRGVVMSVSDDGQEAVVQVQGVQLRAALETPLQKGQTTLLQVQPPGKDGMIVLKPLNLPSAASFSEASLAGMLGSFGLENSPENRELLKLMQTQGIPLTKDQALALSESLAGKPQNVPLEQWVQSAAIAYHRGLPVTAASVAGLHQAVFGAPLQNLLTVLGDQVADLLTALLKTEDQTGTKASGQDASGSGALRATFSTGEAVDPEGNTTGKVAGTPSSVSAGNVAAPSAAAAKSSELLIKLQSLLGELRALGSEEALNSVTVKTVNTSQAGSAATAAATMDMQSEAEASTGNAAEASKTGARGSAINGGNPAAAQTAPGLAGMDAKALSEQGKTAAPPAAGGAANPAAPAGAAATAAGAAVPAPGEEGAAPMQAAPQPQGEAPAAASPGPGRTHEAEPWVARVLRLLGAEHEQHTARAVALTASPAQADAAHAEGAARAGSAAAGGAPAPGGDGPLAGSAGTGAPAEAAPARSGAAQALPGTAAPSGQQGRHGAAVNAPLPDASAAAAMASMAADEPAAAIRETLKSVLMQVLDSGDMPPQLQETAKQLVNQLTGQQLLMNTDRTAPFAQFTMFLPFTGPDGDQTASVHIQSRRGKRGELDAANCRLWFDLQMKHLGQVMVDVQVADKKVILKVHSDQEAVGAFIESRQDEIKSAIEASGYRLLSLKAEAMEAASKAGGSEAIPPLYVPQAYKGVDYRI